MTAPTSGDIRDAWLAAVWSDAQVLSYTPKIYLHDVSIESEFDVERLCHEGVVNFFLCKVQRQSAPLVAGNTRYTFKVAVEYHLQQADSSSNTYNDVEDRLGVVDGLVLSGLTGDWSETVDYYTGGVPLTIKPVRISGRQCWMGGLTYTAFKTT